MKPLLDGHKRVITLILTLVVVASRRLGLSPDETALLLDIVELIVLSGLGAHAAAQFVKAKAAAKAAKAATSAALAVLMLSGCSVSTLSGCVVDVSKSDSSRDQLRCDGHQPIKLPRMDPKLRQCVLDGGTP